MTKTKFSRWRTYTYEMFTIGIWHVEYNYIDIIGTSTIYINRAFYLLCSTEWDISGNTSPEGLGFCLLGRCILHAPSVHYSAGFFFTQLVRHQCFVAVFVTTMITNFLSTLQLRHLSIIAFQISDNLTLCEIIVDSSLITRRVYRSSLHHGIQKPFIETLQIFFVICDKTSYTFENCHWLFLVSSL